MKARIARHLSDNVVVVVKWLAEFVHDQEALIQFLKPSNFLSRYLLCNLLWIRTFRK